MPKKNVEILEGANQKDKEDGDMGKKTNVDVEAERKEGSGKRST